MSTRNTGNSQQNGQIYYDQGTNQYYTQPSQSYNQNYGAGTIFAGLNNLVNPTNNKNYLTNFNNQSMIKPNTTPYNYIDINALFPQLMQGTTNSQGNASLLGSDTTGGAAQSASSGAGRFM